MKLGRLSCVRRAFRFRTMREPGTVVYIHPAGRFYIAELDLPGGKVREAFPMTGGEPDAVTD